MENVRKIRRVCNFCGKDFTLTKSQMRQVKEKWAVNCSKSCARKAQHAKNHADKRKVKKCDNCGAEFKTTNWNKGRMFCSTSCSSIARFGDPKRRKKKMLQKIEAILKDERYMAYLQSISKKIGLKYGVDCNDIFQDYFVALLEGQNCFIEQTAMTTVRKEYNRGICGKWKAKEITVSGEAIDLISKRGKKSTEIEKLELLNDLRAVTSSFEFLICKLLLQGFRAIEIKDRLTTGNDRFWQTWKKITHN